MIGKDRFRKKLFLDSLYLSIFFGGFYIVGESQGYATAFGAWMMVAGISNIAARKNNHG